MVVDPDEIGPPGARRADLPDGRTLVVREATPADVDGLVALYSTLSADDLHLRFFSVFRPPRSFFERLVEVPAVGGCVLVAEVHDPDGRRSLVADVWYAAPVDGEAELAITIDPGWRGWLGPYLLDALAEVAAARGVRNLVAVVLPENRSMIALMKHRPHVVVDDGDFTTVQIAIGARTRVPGWPADDHGHPRVLVESPAGRWRAAAAARRAGLDVRVCPGPPAGHPERCPALVGEPCPLAAEADAIVLSFRDSATLCSSLVGAHARLHPDPPVVVEAPGEAHVVAGATVVVPRTLADGELADRVVALATERHRQHAAGDGEPG